MQVSKNQTQLLAIVELVKKIYGRKGEIFFVKIPNLIMHSFTIIVSLKVFFDLKSDSVAILNFSFAILGGLAGLCFTWSGTFSHAEKANGFIKELGEKFFYSAILIIVASCIHFELTNIDRVRIEYDPFHIDKKFYDYLTLGFKILASIIFYRAANIALDKICKLHFLLYKRNRNQ